MRLNSDQIFVCDAVECLPVHVEKALLKLLMYQLTTNRDAVNLITSLLDKLVSRSVEKTINKPKVLARITKAVLDNSKSATPASALVKSEKRQFTEKQAKFNSRFRKFVEAGVKIKND